MSILSGSYQLLFAWAWNPTGILCFHDDITGKAMQECEGDSAVKGAVIHTATNSCYTNNAPTIMAVLTLFSRTVKVSPMSTFQQPTTYTCYCPNEKNEDRFLEERMQTAGTELTVLGIYDGKLF